jgi:hypothetical protein
MELAAKMVKDNKGTIDEISLEDLTLIIPPCEDLSLNKRDRSKALTALLRER